MRARSYPASKLLAMRSDGDQGGYVNTVVAYQSDGLREYALMSVPDRARPAKGWPVIVINHGYSDPATYQTDGSPYSLFVSAYARAATPSSPPTARRRRTLRSGTAHPRSATSTRITAMVQINQDVGDTVVPKILSDHLAAALRAAGKVFEYHTYPGDDHQFLRNRASVLAATVTFYRAHL
jgi:hypothetical protein